MIVSEHRVFRFQFTQEDGIELAHGVPYTFTIEGQTEVEAVQKLQTSLGYMSGTLGRYLHTLPKGASS